VALYLLLPLVAVVVVVVRRSDKQHIQTVTRATLYDSIETVAHVLLLVHTQHIYEV
jgi:hypothetical protein